jgi:hypothetical protein
MPVPSPPAFKASSPEALADIVWPKKVVDADAQAKVKLTIAMIPPTNPITPAVCLFNFSPFKYYFR